MVSLKIIRTNMNYELELEIFDGGASFNVCEGKFLNLFLNEKVMFHPIAILCGVANIREDLKEMKKPRDFLETTETFIPCRRLDIQETFPIKSKIEMHKTLHEELDYAAWIEMQKDAAIHVAVNKLNSIRKKIRQSLIDLLIETKNFSEPVRFSFDKKTFHISFSKFKGYCFDSIITIRTDGNEREKTLRLIEFLAGKLMIYS